MQKKNLQIKVICQVMLLSSSPSIVTQHEIRIITQRWEKTMMLPSGSWFLYVTQNLTICQYFRYLTNQVDYYFVSLQVGSYPNRGMSLWQKWWLLQAVLLSFDSCICQNNSQKLGSICWASCWGQDSKHVRLYCLWSRPPRIKLRVGHWAYCIQLYPKLQHLMMLMSSTWQHTYRP